MLDDKILERIKYLKKDHVQFSDTMLIIEETKEDGKAKLDISLTHPSVAFKKVDENKLPYISHLKCADNIIFEYNKEKWELHIFEFKKTVKLKNWISIKEQFKGAILNALSLAGFLGITFDLENVKLYTGFRKCKIEKALKTNPVLIKKLVGAPKEDIACDWDNGQANLKILDKSVFVHKKIQLNEENGEGKFRI